MRFHLNPEQVAIQDVVRRTLEQSWPMERRHRFADADRDFDPETWRELMELGVGGLALAEADGGAGLGLLEAALVCEVVGSAVAPGPIIGQILTGIAVATSSNSDVKAHLPSIASGAEVATLALRGDLVQSARAARFFLAEESSGELVLIEAGDGVRIEAVASTDRTRPVSKVAFDGPKSHVLFAANDPKKQHILDAALILIAADALGGAQHCVDLSVAYAKEREQFGQPIGRFQGLKHQLAHMALDVEPARALVWYAAYAWDRELPDASRASAIAKAHLSDVFTRSARAAIAAHGGIGYTWEYGLHYWLRRAIVNSAWLGSPGTHRARAAALAEW